MNRILILIASYVIFACSPSPKNEDIATNTLGTLQHYIPVSEAAKPAFEQGLLLLHSFEYEDARESFNKALSADSTEVMAYWGVAMSHYRALWGLVNIPEGRKIMEALAPDEEQRIAKTEAGLERELWKGIEILYGDGELKDRNEKYTEHMASTYEQYSENQEIAAFYALALMWSAAIDSDDEVYKLSAHVAQGILSENPNHPGAVHYVIHAYDNPDLSHLAIEAADKYATIAPDAAHALHMPSHIYLSRGMWNKVVESNEASYQASLNRMERKNLDDNARGYHSYQWLHYGYLQQGRFDEANELLNDMLQYTEITQSKSARSYLIKMQNMQVIESGTWSLKKKPMSIKTADIGIEKQAQEHFFKALMAYKNGDVNIIVNQIDSIEEKINTAELLVTSAGISMCSAGPARYAPNKYSILNARTMQQQMEAMHDLILEDDKAAEDHFKKAVEMESIARYSYGPPDVVFPSFEQYGYWLMDNERYKEAIDLFDKSMERAPQRALALKGKIASLKEIGKNEEASSLESELSKFWQPKASNI